jgi:hypothetical protein
MVREQLHIHFELFTHSFREDWGDSTLEFRKE